MDQLEGQRRKLLRLYYDDRIGADLFAEKEARLALAIAAGHGESQTARAPSEVSHQEVDSRGQVLDRVGAGKGA